MSKRELPDIAGGIVLSVIILVVVHAGCQSIGTDKIESAWRGELRMREVSLPSEEGGTTRLFEVEGPTGAIGYLVEKQVTSRSGPFKIRVLLDLECHVKQAMVTSYPGARGREVRSPKFTDQFKGKGPSDPIRLGKDIDAISGATISSRVMTVGVHDAVKFIERIKKPIRITLRNDT